MVHVVAVMFLCLFKGKKNKRSEANNENYADQKLQFSNTTLNDDNDC